MNNHTLEIKKRKEWVAILYKKNDGETEKIIVGIINADNYQSLIVEIGCRNWIDLINNIKR